MSDYTKGRILLILMVVFCAGLNLWHWYYRIQSSRFYPVLSLLGPVALLLFLLFAVRPNLMVQPRDKKSEIIVNSVGGIGLIIGAINWYLMVNGF